MAIVKMQFESDLSEYAIATHLRFARGARNAAERMQGRSKLLLRSETRGALGDRVANAWRADIYPASAGVHTHQPAVYVHTNAPNIIQAFNDATLIVARNGTYLAIPTSNVPRRGWGGNRRATPAEVKALYGIEDFKIVPRPNGTLLGFVPAVRARSGKGFRRASSIRTGKQNRKAEMILMFVFVKQVGLKKRLNTDAIFAQLDAFWAEVFPAEIAAALAEGSN